MMLMLMMVVVMVVVVVVTRVLLWAPSNTIDYNSIPVLYIYMISECVTCVLRVCCVCCAFLFMTSTLINQLHLVVYKVPGTVLPFAT